MGVLTRRGHLRRSGALSDYSRAVLRTVRHVTAIACSSTYSPVVPYDLPFLPPERRLESMVADVRESKPVVLIAEPLYSQQG